MTKRIHKPHPVSIPTPYEQELIDMSYEEMVERADTTNIKESLGEEVHESEEGDVTKD